jgi:hypothetical protein
LPWMASSAYNTTSSSCTNIFSRHRSAIIGRLAAVVVLDRGLLQKLVSCYQPLRPGRRLAPDRGRGSCLLSRPSHGGWRRGDAGSLCHLLLQDLLAWRTACNLFSVWHRVVVFRLVLALCCIV